MLLVARGGHMYAPGSRRWAHVYMLLVAGGGHMYAPGSRRL